MQSINLIWPHIGLQNHQNKAMQQSEWRARRNLINLKNHFYIEAHPFIKARKEQGDGIFKNLMRESVYGTGTLYLY